MIDHQLIFLFHLHPCIHHNYHHITHQLIFLHHLHPRIHYNNHHHIAHRLIFLNHDYYTPLHSSTNLQLVLFRDCCNQKTPDITQWYQIFYSGCSIKEKVCNLITDNRSCENMVSRALINHLMLETKPHPHPYTIGWITKGKGTDICHVSISITKFYQDSVACDVVDMNACHILLGRPLQYDVDATHRGQENIYVFPWKGKRVSTRPIIPIPNPAEKRNLNSYPYAIEVSSWWN